MSARRPRRAAEVARWARYESMECPDTPACAKGCVCHQEVDFMSSPSAMASGVETRTPSAAEQSRDATIRTVLRGKVPDQSARVQLAACKDTSTERKLSSELHYSGVSQRGLFSKAIRLGLYTCILYFIYIYGFLVCRYASSLGLAARQFTPAIDGAFYRPDSPSYQLQPSFHT